MGSFSGGPKVGQKMKLYRNAGSVGTPTWTLLAEVSDVNIPDLANSGADLKRRASNWTKKLPSIFDAITVEAKMPSGLDSTNFTYLQGAFFNQTPFEMAVLNGAVATTGTQGLRLPVLLSNFPWDQPLESIASHDLKFHLAYMEDTNVEVDPSWMTV